MGLLNLLMPGNPVSSWADANPYTVSGLGAGLSSIGQGMVGWGNDIGGMMKGINGALGQARGPMAQYAQMQRESDQQAAEVKKAQNQQNYTIQALQKAGRQDLIDAIQGGGMSISDAWGNFLTPKDAKKQYQVVGDKLYDLSGDTPTLAVDPYASTGGVDPKEAFNREKDLSSQYLNTDPLKSYQTVRNGYEKLRSSAQLKTGAGDVSMIFAYMKMLDPTSVVREGEFATAQQTAGLPQTVVNLYNQALSGVRLNDQQRAEFLNAADQIYQAASGNLADINQQFSTRAQGWGVTPGNFIVQPEFYSPLQQPSQLPPTLTNGTGTVNPFGSSTGNTITLPDGTTIEVY